MEQKQGKELPSRSSLQTQVKRPIQLCHDDLLPGQKTELTRGLHLKQKETSMIYASSPAGRRINARKDTDALLYKAI